jgi:trk system potassium uptake protein TrkA
MLEVSPHPEWAGYEVAQVEVSTGARVSSLVRFGRGLLPTADTVVQEGDRIYLAVTDDVRDRALGVLSAAPDRAAEHGSRT